MSDQYTPEAICNVALQEAGIDFYIGNLTEGTRPAQVLLRRYSDCVRNLLRTAPWNFCRKQAPLLCVGDSTGQTPNVSLTVPSQQFLYSYAWPTDAAFIRYVPWFPFVSPAVPTGNITPSDPSAPIMEGVPQTWQWSRIYPARFLVTSDQSTIPPGASNDAPGVAPTGRTVICANVPPSVAQVIYSYEAMYCNLWSPSFREAMIAYLAAEVALPLNQDKKLGMQLRQANIAIALQKIKDCRVAEGRESFSNSDLDVDWMRTRASGGAGQWGGIGYGFGAGIGGGDMSCSWDNLLIGNSTAY